ncbi:glycosyltransferase (plasmid) [Edwardsiella tarda]|uniref:glycosyltransferase n=1 Tax=Edwardsiella tarda TaxID=636 RepID=UPI00244487AD|nr:glycosyltransferase [Edwardsiella tarda]WGE30955.1 glycosyltransferase [Edwardsiella tarda]
MNQMIIEVDKNSNFFIIHPPENTSQKNTPLTISAILITKDEERCISRCISSVLDKVDEIIILDTGSNDKTIEIIKSFDNKKIKLFFSEWNDDFSQARNLALSKAIFDFIIFIDSDEELISSKDELIYAFNLLNIQDNSDEYVICPEITDHNKNKCIGVPRGFKNKKGFYFFGFVHEELRSKYYKTLFSIHLKIKIKHDGYEKSVILNKNKLERNISLIRKNMLMEPLNIRWKYFYLRDSFDTQSPADIITEIYKILKKDINKQMEESNLTKSTYTFALLDILSRAHLKNMSNPEMFFKCIELMDSLYPENTNSIYYRSLYHLFIWKNKSLEILNEIISSYNKPQSNFGMISSEGYHIDAIFGIYLFECGFYGKAKDILLSLDSESFHIDILKKYSCCFNI